MNGEIRKLALVDYEGVLSDSTKRHALALESGFTTHDDEYWEIAFKPENILELDDPIPNALENLDRLKAEGWTIIFLTSIPYRSEGAVFNWLVYTLGWPEEDLNIDIVSKPNALQKNRTSTWKANMVNVLSSVFDEVLFIDDEEKNIDAVLTNRQIAWRMDRGLRLRTAKSLEEALTPPVETKEQATEEEEEEKLELEDMPF